MGHSTTYSMYVSQQRQGDGHQALRHQERLFNK